MRKWMGSLAVAALSAAAGLGASDLPAHAQDQEKPYDIVDGKVDQGTYNGYRRYHSQCHVCHGPDGLGSSYAPSLIESLQRIDQDEFNEVVINGRQASTAGRESVMPSFGHVEDVVLYLEDIYAYLQARADGALGRGRPQRQ